MLSNNQAKQMQVGDIPKHIICFVAVPFEDSGVFAYKTVLLPALREVLELHPYYWQVGRADDNYFSDTIYDNIAHWMKSANVYIAEISDLNPNVMMELGYMYWTRKANQPLIVLERLGTSQQLADLAGVIRIRYPVLGGNHAIEDIAKALRIEFGKRQDIQQLRTAARAHYLSPLLLTNVIGANSHIADILAKEYKTMEAFVYDSVESVCLRLRNSGVDVDHNIVAAYQKAVKKLLNGLKGSK